VNLANCRLRHSHILALHVLLPDLHPDIPGLPRGAIDLGDRYILLRAQDKRATLLDGERADAIRTFLLTELGDNGIPVDWQPRYMQWARLQLPNLQIARCLWKETSWEHAVEGGQHSRNVKVS
jgi:hypothetical protein